MKGNGGIVYYGYAYFWRNPLIAKVEKCATGFLV